MRCMGAVNSNSPRAHTENHRRSPLGAIPVVVTVLVGLILTPVIAALGESLLTAVVIGAISLPAQIMEISRGIPL